jgi:hypothetical protein
MLIARSSYKAESESMGSPIFCPERVSELALGCTCGTSPIRQIGDTPSPKAFLAYLGKVNRSK